MKDIFNRKTVFLELNNLIPQTYPMCTGKVELWYKNSVLKVDQALFVSFSYVFFSHVQLCVQGIDNKGKRRVIHSVQVSDPTLLSASNFS